MFCPKCGAQNPDGATFCGSCGAPATASSQPQQPAATTPAPYAPGPGGAAAAPKGGVNNRTVLIGLIAVAAIVVIAIIVGVVTCSGGAGKVNLNSLVSDKPDAIAGQLEKMSKGKVEGETVLAPSDEARDLVKKVAKAFGSDKKDMKNLKEDIQKLNPWCVALMDEDGGFLDAGDVKGGDDPSSAIYLTYRVLESPTSEDIAKIAGEACSYDKVVMGEKDDRFTGCARTDDCVILIYAEEYEGVYQVSATCYRLDEVDNDDSLEDRFDDYYDDYEDKDFDDYYRK